jgi:ACS family hexuronate transporter-like MFS transporter
MLNPGTRHLRRNAIRCCRTATSDVWLIGGVLSPAQANALFILALSATHPQSGRPPDHRRPQADDRAGPPWSDDDYGTLGRLFQGAAASAFLFTGSIVDKVGVKWANPLGARCGASRDGPCRGPQLRQFISAGSRSVPPRRWHAGRDQDVAAIFPPARRSTGYGLLNTDRQPRRDRDALVIPHAAAAWGWRSAFLWRGLGLIWSLLWLVTVRASISARA